MKPGSYCRTSITPYRRRWLELLNGNFWGLVVGPILLTALFWLVPRGLIEERYQVTVVLALVFLICTPLYLRLKRLLRRTSLYQNGDFVEDLSAFGGEATYVDEQHTKGRLRGLLVRATIDRGYRDKQKLGGPHFEETANQLLQEFPGIGFVDARFPSEYFLDRYRRFMLRTSLVDLYWLADLKPLTGATLRLQVEQAGKIVVKVLTANAELEAAVNATKQALTIPDSLLEVSAGPSWLRVRVVGGSWLGKQFSGCIKESVAFAEALTERLHSRYSPLSLDAWTLNDQLEAVPIGR